MSRPSALGDGRNPTGVHRSAAHGARIDALSESARTVLRVASVIGVRFDPPMVEDVLGDPVGSDVYDRLSEASLIVPADAAGWRFSHPLIHDAAYWGLLAAARRRLHARVADRLEPAFTPDDLESTVIALPLLNELKEKGADRTYDIIIDVNRDYPGGRDRAQQRIKELIAEISKGQRQPGRGVHHRKTATTSQYVFGELRGDPGLATAAVNVLLREALCRIKPARSREA